MPAKNSAKTYLENGIYHLYNRGVDKRNIFMDNQDYSVFLSYLKTYLVPKNTKKLLEIIASKEIGYKEKDKAFKEIALRNFSGEIELLGYALMPNHFHLLIRQTAEDGIDRFMNSLSTRYAMFFNRKHNRTGTLYQGVYKAVFVENDEQLLHLSRYINLNPLTKLGWAVSRWHEISSPYSLPEYLGRRKTDWLKPNYVLDYFNRQNPNKDYANFISLEANFDFELVAPVALDWDVE